MNRFGMFHFVKAVHLGFFYISIPVGWDDDEELDGELWRRYETKSLSIHLDKPSDWEPKRPCCYIWKYDGRKQRVFAGLGLCLRLGDWPKDFLYHANNKTKRSTTHEQRN